MITDAGSLIALVDKRDAHHRVCADFFMSLREPMITTWPCMAEAAYLLRSVGGWPYVASLWSFYDRGFLRLHSFNEAEAQRVRALMAAYRDIPCDLADASLIAAAETLGRQEIFTRDGHFYAYRMQDGSAFVVRP